MSAPDLERRPLSKPATVLLALGVLLLVAMPILGWRLYSAWSAFALARPALHEVDGVHAGPFLVVPQGKRYGDRLASLPLREGLPPGDRKADLEALGKKEPEVLALSAEIGRERFEADWLEGVDDLDATQPKWLDFARMGQVVNFRETRELSRRMNGLGRYLGETGRPRDALRLHLASLAAPRQMMSLSKAGAGLTLIEAMIAIAMIGEAQRGLLDLGEATGWKADLFSPALRERLEDLDGRFSLVAESLRLERTMVASFFHMMNEKAGAKAGRKVVIHDAEAVLRRTARFFPDLDRLELPYEEIREELAAKTKLILAETRLGTWDYVKGVLFPMDLVERVMTAIAIPNTARAIEREFQRRALLRGCYLAHAIAAHRARWGMLPASLDALGPETKPQMRLDPFTGRPFRYVVEGESFRLWSTGKACRDGEDEPTQDAVLVVPWKGKL